MAELTNRVHEALEAFKRMEEHNVNAFPPQTMNSAEFAELRLKKLNEVAAKLSFTSNVQERDSLAILAITRKQLYETAYPQGRGFRKFLNWIAAPFIFEARKRIAKRKQDMNLRKIQESMQRAGFSNYVGKVFERIRQGEREISLPTSVLNQFNEQVHHNLNFSYDEVFGHSFESFRTNYRNALNPGIYKNHTFSVHDSNINAKQAEDLIAGRAILETISENGQVMQQWIKLDTKKDEQGNFLMKHISNNSFDVIKHCQQQLPFWKNLDLFKQLKIVGELITGKRSIIDMDYQGNPLRIQIEADPESRIMKVFDEKGKPVDLKNLAEHPLKPANNHLSRKTAQSQYRKKTPAVRTTQQKTSVTRQHTFKNKLAGEKNVTNRKRRTRLSH